MSDDRYDDMTYTGRVIRESDKGLLVKIRDTEGWLPKSQVGRHPRVGVIGTIVLPRWLALEKGLGMPNDASDAETPADDAPTKDWRSDADDRPNLDVAKRCEVMEHDLDLIAKMQSQLVRAVAAITRGLQGLHDKDPATAGEGIAQAIRAMSSNPIDQPREEPADEGKEPAPF